jgi:T5SS/PEP-CTERM-associated repeat protein/autotransporter-associated beta strand protein
MFDQESANTKAVGAMRRVDRLRTVLLITTALSVAALSPSRAQEWINPGIGNWLDAANWNNATLPGEHDHSVIGNGGIAEVRDGGVAVSESSVIGTLDGSGTVKVTGPGSMLEAAFLFVGYDGDGTVEIRNGGALSTQWAQIAYSSGTIGKVLVDGPGSSWSIGGNLDLGVGGQADLTISNGGTVSVGNINIGAAGTLNIGASATSEAAAAGMLDAGSISLSYPSASLVFNHNSATTLAADISGLGSITQMGGGTTTLTGDSSRFDGPTRVTDGELRVGSFGNFARLGGHVTVTGGKLGGMGLVEGASIADGGTLAPGDGGIGTLGLGYLYMAGGSTYEVEITSGSSDLVQVTGIAFLDGADVAIKRGMGPLAVDGDGYTILSADSGIYGSFGDIVSDYAFVAPSLDYDDNLVLLKFARNGVGFADVAATANQVSAAAAIEAQASGGMYGSILSLNEAEARAAFDALSGEAHATLKGVLMHNAGLVSDALLQRLDSARSIDGAGAASGYAALPTLPDAAGGNGVWGQLYGGLGDRAGDSNAANAAFSSGGLVLGADAAVGDWQLGVAAQVGETQMSIADRTTEATSADIGAAFYAGANWGDTGFSLAATVAQHAIATSREVGFGVNETLTADYGATTGQVVAELEHEVDFGAASLVPYARAGHVVQATDAFEEIGNGAGAALSGEADLVSQSFATLGLRGAYQFVVGQGGLATFSGGIGWRRGFGEAPTAHLGFQGGSPFDIAATPATDNSALLEAGFDLDLASGLDVTLSYAGALSATGQSQAVKAGLSAQF